VKRTAPHPVREIYATAREHGDRDVTQLMMMEPLSAACSMGKDKAKLIFNTAICQSVA
jgi:hypothetical protein